MNERPIRRERGYKKVLPQGVIDPQMGAAPGRNPWVRRIGVVMFLSVLGATGYFLAEPVANLLDRPFKQVKVEGEFRYLSKERTSELINAELDNHFLRMDLMRLKAVLESDPWVEHAALGRRWPDTLYVKIVEQKPIARWGELGFMNQRGEIITIDASAHLLGLPQLNGSEADAGRILQQYQDLSQLLRSRRLEIIALSCDAKKSWRLTLKDGIEIAIGRDQVMEKMRRFLTVYDQHLQKLWTDVRAIDVRYTNGVAIQWQPDSVAQKQFVKSL